MIRKWEYFKRVLKMKKEEKQEILRKIKNLRTDLKYTLLAIDGKNEILDSVFKEQAQRLEKEIETLKKTDT